MINFIVDYPRAGKTGPVFSGFQILPSRQRDKQDPVIWHGFFAIDGPDVPIIWIKGDIRAKNTGPVIPVNGVCKEAG
jgi:hypothetical protein